MASTSPLFSAPCAIGFLRHSIHLWPSWYQSHHQRKKQKSTSSHSRWEKITWTRPSSSSTTRVIPWGPSEIKSGLSMESTLESISLVKSTITHLFVCSIVHSKWKTWQASLAPPYSMRSTQLWAHDYPQTMTNVTAIMASVTSIPWYRSICRGGAKIDSRGDRSANHRISPASFGSRSQAL